MILANSRHSISLYLGEQKEDHSTMKPGFALSVLALVVATGGVSAFVPAPNRISSPFEPRVPLHHLRTYDQLSSPISPSRSVLQLAKSDIPSPAPSSKSSIRSNLFKSLALLSLVVVFWKRQALQAFLSYAKNEWLLTSLDRLGAAGPVGLIGYTIMFMLWTMVFGITTPVETAAGMAFGVIPGIVASGSGKFLGALFTFLLARYKFADQVRRKMESNELLLLIEESVEETPFRVALLCRFSPLPEFLKNGSMGVLPVPKRAFIASLIVHGLSFTCLWTCMGAETGRVLRGLPPSPALKILMTGATWIGFGAPVCIGVWIKSLKDKQKERRQRESSEESSNETEVL
jgi:uncharacterized membrane protein YdjX (TVP38/TMEM64 family)